MTLHPIKRGLEHGSIVQLAPDDRRIMRPDGTMVTRPAVGVRLIYEPIGRLALPTGKIVAADPYLLTMAELCIPLNKTLPPADYEVWTVLAETRTQSLPAFAVLQISDEPAVRCQLAIGENEDPAMLNEELTGGVGVDTGIAVMIDPSHIPLLGPDGIGANEPLAAHVHAATSESRPYSAVVPLSEPASIAVWRSGFGDGSYTPFWGFDRHGNPCYFAIDFDLVGNALYTDAVPASSIGDSLRYIP